MEHRPRGRIRVLTYHRIAEIGGDTRLDPRLISTTPSIFAEQMTHLAGHYKVVTLREVIDAVRGIIALPRTATLITFDDGYRDLKDHAFPVLKRLGLPATVFVPTAFVDRPDRQFWWDRVYHALMSVPRRALELEPLGSLPLGDPTARLETIRRVQNHVLTLPHAEAMRVVDAVCGEAGPEGGARSTVLCWDDLRHACRSGGITVAAHTRTHPILTRMPLEEARAEIVGSLRDVEREIPGALPAFCYPNGDHNDEVCAAVRDAGVSVAFTTRNGHNRLAHADPLRLSRQSIYKRSSLPVFRARLTTIGGYLDTWRSRA